MVEDYYKDAEGDLVMVWERITADPSDKGQCYPDSTWSREARKDYREFKGCDYQPEDIRISWRRNLPRVTEGGRS